MTTTDKKRLSPFLGNATKLKEWLASHPPEEDVWTLYQLEMGGKKRTMLLSRLLTRAQRLERIRKFGKDGR